MSGLPTNDTAVPHKIKQIQKSGTITTVMQETVWNNKPMHLKKQLHGLQQRRRKKLVDQGTTSVYFIYESVINEFVTTSGPK